MSFLVLKVTKDSVFTCQGYEYETTPGDISDSAFVSRKDTGLQKEIVCYGRLQADVFSSDRLLLPNVNVRIKLLHSRPDFYLISDTNGAYAKIVEASLFTRQVAVDEGIVKSIKSHLVSKPVGYNYFEQLLKTFIIPRGQNQFFMTMYLTMLQFDLLVS